jgi:hypothetical protein
MAINDDTSQEAMAIDECPVKQGRCILKMCTCHEISMSWGQAWCSEGKVTLVALDEEADEDEDMGNDNANDIKVTLMATARTLT